MLPILLIICFTITSLNLQAMHLSLGGEPKRKRAIEHKEVKSDSAEQQALMTELAKQSTYRNDLMLAAIDGNIDAVKEILKSKTLTQNMIHAQDPLGRTALMWAIDRRHPEIAQLLIDHEADVNKQDKDGLTALMLAVDENFPKLAIKLKQAGAKVNLQDKNGDTALMRAAAKGNQQLVASLLDAADPFIENKKKQTALTIAMLADHEKIAFLITKKMEELSALMEQLVEASKTGNAKRLREILEFLKTRELRPRPLLEVALLDASFFGRHEIVSLLLAAGADINYQSPETPLLTASFFIYRQNVIPILLAAKPNLDLQDSLGNTALIYAIQELLTYSVGSDETHLERNNLQKNIITQILNGGATVNIKNNKGETALTLAKASDKQYPEIIEMLEKAQAHQAKRGDFLQTKLVFS